MSIQLDSYCVQCNVKCSHFELCTAQIIKGQQEWDKLFKIFQYKSENFLRYQTRRFLLEKKPNNRHWDVSQQKILSSLIKKVTELQQSMINQRSKSQQSEMKLHISCLKNQSKNFSELPNNVDKDGLTTQIQIKGQQTVEEELSLSQKVEERGKKWAQLGQYLNRNEHCVKNNYNSIISHQKKVTPLVKKQQKLQQQAKKKLQKQKETQIQPERAGQAVLQMPQDQTAFVKEPKIRIKFKNSSESFFDDNRSFLNYKNEFQNKNKIEFPYCLQGGQFVRHLLKQDDEQDKNQFFNNQNNFWNSSLKMLTRFGLNPSPITFSYSMSEFNKNFHNQMQNWGQNEKFSQNK